MHAKPISDVGLGARARLPAEGVRRGPRGPRKVRGIRAVLAGYEVRSMRYRDPVRPENRDLRARLAALGAAKAVDEAADAAAWLARPLIERLDRTLALCDAPRELPRAPEAPDEAPDDEVETWLRVRAYLAARRPPGARRERGSGTSGEDT